MGKQAKVTIRGINEAKDGLLKAVQNAVKSPDLLSMLGETTQEQIKNRTRGRQEEYKQLPLKKSTTEIRERLIRAGNAIDPTLARPKQSNLTMSGQLLNSIYYRVNQAQATISILLKKDRKPYKGIKKNSLDGSLDNNEIKRDLESQGREFLFVSGKLQLLLESKIAASLRKSIQIYNKIKRKLTQK